MLHKFNILTVLVACCVIFSGRICRTSAAPINKDVGELLTGAIDVEVRSPINFVISNDVGHGNEGRVPLVSGRQEEDSDDADSRREYIGSIRQYGEDNKVDVLSRQDDDDGEDGSAYKLRQDDDEGQDESEYQARQDDDEGENELSYKPRQDDDDSDAQEERDYKPEFLATRQDNIGEIENGADDQLNSILHKDGDFSAVSQLSSSHSLADDA